MDAQSKEIAEAIIQSDLLDTKSPTAIVLSALSDHTGVRFKIASNIDDLPVGAQRWAVDKGYTDGLVSVYDKSSSTVWLIGEQISGPHDAAVAFVHEVIGHHGVRRVLHDDHAEVMHKVYESFAESPLLESIKDRYALDTSVASNRLILAEELISSMAETGVRPNTYSQLSGVFSQKLDGASRNSIAYTEQDIRTLLVKARDSLRDIPRGDVKRPFACFPKAETLNRLLTENNPIQIQDMFGAWLKENFEASNVRLDTLEDRNVLLDLFGDYLNKSHGIQVNESGELVATRLSPDVKNILKGESVRVQVNHDRESSIFLLKNGVPAGTEIRLSDATVDSHEYQLTAMVSIDSLDSTDNVSTINESIPPSLLASPFEAGRYHALYVGSKSHASESTSNAFSEATRLYAEGEDMQVIWERTGWQDFLGTGWSYEISDNFALTFEEAKAHETYLRDRVSKVAEKIREIGPDEGLMASLSELQKSLGKLSFILNESIPGTLGAFLYHPELYAHYPDIADIKVEVSAELGTGVGGYYDASEDKIVISSDCTGELLRKVLLHEPQHAIQHREMWKIDESPTFMYDIEDLESKLSSLRNSDEYRQEYSRYISRTDSAYDKFDRKEIASRALLRKTLKGIENDFISTPVGLAESTIKNDLQSASQERTKAKESDRSEIMAYDVVSRFRLSPEQRKRIRPFSSKTEIPQGRGLRSDVQYMFAGDCAVSADRSMLDQAKGMYKAFEFGPEHEKQYDTLASKPSIFLSLTDSVRLVDLESRRKAADNLDDRVKAITGWVRGPAEQYLYEIPDTNAKIANRVEDLRRRDLSLLAERSGDLPMEIINSSVSGNIIRNLSYPISEILDHPELFEAYPQLAILTARATDDSHVKGVHLDMPGGSILYSKCLSDEKLLSGLLSQLQRVVEAINDFPISPEGYNSVLPTPEYLSRYKLARDARLVIEQMAMNNIPADNYSAQASSFTSDPEVIHYISEIHVDEVFKFEVDLRHGAIFPHERNTDNAREVESQNIFTNLVDEPTRSTNSDIQIESNFPLQMNFVGIPAPFLVRMDNLISKLAAETNMEVSHSVQEAYEALTNARHEQLERGVRISGGLALERGGRC